MSAPDSRLEPDTVADTDDGHCLHSIAISLKRIADVAEAIIDHSYDAPAVRVRKD